jgi:hypothetical protein
MTNVMFRRSRCRRSRVEKLRNGRDKLRWRERPLQKDAFGYALRSPLSGSRPGHVDYGNSGSTSLSSLATSQPFILPFRQTSVTSAL